MMRNRTWKLVLARGVALALPLVGACQRAPTVVPAVVRDPANRRIDTRAVPDVPSSTTRAKPQPPRKLVVGLYHDEMPSWALLDLETTKWFVLPERPNEQPEERVTTRLMDCALGNQALLGNSRSLRFQGEEGATDIPLQKDETLWQASLEPHARFLAMVVSEGHGESSLRLVTLTRALEPTDAREIELPARCSEPSMLWQFDEARVAVLCSDEILIVDAETKALQTITVHEVSGLLGWRGSPAALIVTRLPSRTSNDPPSTDILTLDGARTLWPDRLASWYLPHSDSLVFHLEDGGYEVADLTTRTTSLWFPELPPVWHEIVASTPDGRWVALLDGQDQDFGPDLRVLDTTTGTSRLAWRAEERYRVASAAFCPRLP